MIVGATHLLLKTRAQIPQDYLAHYTFDNVSGTTIFDESANNYDMTTFNSPTFAAGVSGNQIETVAASSQYAEASIPELQSMNVGTLLFFADADIGTGTGNRSVVSVGNGGIRGSMLRISTAGVLSWSTQSTSANFIAIGTTDISTGTHMIAISSDGSTTTAWVDDSAESISFSTGTNNGAFFNDLSLTSLNLNIGILDRSDGPFYYNSGVDELYLYERVLSSDELLSIYNTYL